MPTLRRHFPVVICLDGGWAVTRYRKYRSGRNFLFPSADWHVTFAPVGSCRESLARAGAAAYSSRIWRQPFTNFVRYHTSVIRFNYLRPVGVSMRVVSFASHGRGAAINRVLAILRYTIISGAGAQRGRATRGGIHRQVVRPEQRKNRWGPIDTHVEISLFEPATQAWIQQERSIS